MVAGYQLLLGIRLRILILDFVQVEVQIEYIWPRHQVHVRLRVSYDLLVENLMWALVLYLRQLAGHGLIHLLIFIWLHHDLPLPPVDRRFPILLLDSPVAARLGSLLSSTCPTRLSSTPRADDHLDMGLLRLHRTEV